MPFLVQLEGIYAQNEEAIALNEGRIVKNELSVSIFDIADVKNGYIIHTVIQEVISK